MGMHRKILLLSVAIAVLMGSLLAVSFTFTAAATATTGSSAMYSQQRERYSNNPSGQVPISPMNIWSQMLTLGRNFLTHGNYMFPHRGQNMSGNVIINSTQAKSVVEADIPNLKGGTPTSFQLNWIIPIEDEQGIVTMLRVGNINANTSDQAQNIVTTSLAKGWTTGAPKLVKTVYYVPLLDSNGKPMSYMRVDGQSGNIILTSSPTPAVTSAQAKTTVSNAIKNFTIGDVKERVGAWTVTIHYSNKTVMTIILGKINTPTSEDAVNTVKSSLENGWTPGEPKQQRSIFTVPILDTNSNIIGSIRVNGRTGDIVGFPTVHRWV
jgi:hypothetical protein